MSEKSHKDAITSAAITSDADQHGHETAENDKAEPSVKELCEMAVNDISKISGEISVEASTKDCVCNCACACADEEPTEEKIFNNIQKSKIDKREYRGMVLKNGLRVMLISDVDTNRSAVCLDVNVGSWSDPPELPGLAHFVEHMLFLGTEKVFALFPFTSLILLIKPN